MSDQGNSEKSAQSIESSSPETTKKSTLAQAAEKFKQLMEKVLRRKEKPGKPREVLETWATEEQLAPTAELPESSLNSPTSGEIQPVPAENNPDATQSISSVDVKPPQVSADGAKPAASTETSSVTTPTTVSEGSNQSATPAQPTEEASPAEARPSSEDDKKSEEKPVTTQEELKNLLEARRATVRAALREIAQVLLQHKDPLVIMVVQAIGAEETPAGDQLREAILEQAKDACEKSYPKNKLQLPKDIIAQSPLTTEGVSVENTPLADLLVKKLGVKREDLKMEGESVQQQSQRLYEQFMGSRFGAVLGRELFGPDWIKKFDLQNKDIFQLFGRLLHRQGLESFKLGKANVLGEMMNAGQDDVQLTRQEKGLFNATLRGIGRQAVWEEFLAKRHGILESPGVHIGLLVFMTVLQTAQQSERGGSQGPEH